jgi:hypothetical protein
LSFTTERLSVARLNAAQINAKRKQKRKVQRVILVRINIRPKAKRGGEGGKKAFRAKNGVYTEGSFFRDVWFCRFCHSAGILSLFMLKTSDRWAAIGHNGILLFNKKKQKKKSPMWCF